MSTQGFSTAAPIKINKWLEAGTFNNFHLKMLVAALILVAMEGYDLFVIGSALPLLMKAFKLTAAQAGSAAGAAAVGMFFGSLFVAPLGDKFGRRKVILWAIALACAAMVAAGLSSGLASFWLSRFVFGVAHGALLANLMALVSEYVPGTSRQTVVGVIMCGMQVGGIIGALLGILMFARYGWRPVFLMAAIPIVLFQLYRRWLPEGSSFLARNNRLNEIRDYLRKARPSDTLLEESALEVEKGKNKLPLAEVFKEHRVAGTLLLWACWGVNMYVNYGFSFWLPKLMMNKGFSLSRSISFMFALAIPAIVVTFVAGRIMDRVSAKPVVVVLFLLSCVSIGTMGHTNNYALLMILTSLAGAGINGAQNMINGYAPAYYPPPMRSTVMAYTMTVGRVGGVVGPMLIGVMLSAHISIANAMLLIGLPSVLSAIMFANIPEKYSYTRKLAAAE